MFRLAVEGDVTEDELVVCVEVDEEDNVEDVILEMVDVGGVDVRGDVEADAEVVRADVLTAARTVAAV